MEYVDGLPLAAQLPLPAERAVAVAEQVCAALAYAHARGVVHRDIKPDNILIDADGRVKVADFGIARLSGDDWAITAPQQTAGTPHYQAPEALAGAPPDPRMDLYALGVVLYQSISGQLPIGAFAPLSGRIDRVVRRALAADPARRYRDADEMRHALRAAAPGGRPRAAARRAHLDLRRRPAAGDLVCGGAVGAAAVADAARRRTDRRPAAHHAAGRDLGGRPHRLVGALRNLADPGRPGHLRHRHRGLRRPAPALAPQRHRGTCARPTDSRSPLGARPRPAVLRAVRLRQTGGVGGAAGVDLPAADRWGHRSGRPAAAVGGHPRGLALPPAAVPRAGPVARIRFGRRAADQRVLRLSGALAADVGPQPPRRQEKVRRRRNRGGPFL